MSSASGMEERRGRVCVTGGTGFVGSWIIKTFLEHGYSVNATERSNPENKRDVSFLTNLARASQKLKIFNADLSNPESFSSAIEGCIGVFHVADPMNFEQEEPVEIMTKRCIDGALGILKASRNSKTVKRVVYTSGATAVFCNGKDDEVMYESFWGDVDYLKATKPFVWPHAVSKTLTEKAVLEYGEQNGLDVVTVIPPLVVGPFICPKLPASVRPPLALEFEGRCICSSCLLTAEKLWELLSAKHPEFQLPIAKSLKDIKGPKLLALSSRKLIDAGFEFKYELEEMIENAI